MRRPLLLTVLLLLRAASRPLSAQTATPAETARAMLRQYQEEPARIDRARDLLEADLARGGAADVPTLLALARAWFLFGEERARTDEEKIGAYARARDYARRATELAPNSADAHLWHAITLGTWSQAKGLLARPWPWRELRKEVDVAAAPGPEQHRGAHHGGQHRPRAASAPRRRHPGSGAALQLGPRPAPRSRLTGRRIELAQLDIGRRLRDAEGRAGSSSKSVLAEPARAR